MPLWVDYWRINKWTLLWEAILNPSKVPCTLALCLWSFFFFSLLFFLLWSLSLVLGQQNSSLLHLLAVNILLFEFRSSVQVGQFHTNIDVVIDRMVWHIPTERQRIWTLSILCGCNFFFFQKLILPLASIISQFFLKKLGGQTGLVGPN